MINETICALATPAGGAIAIIRLSGNDAIAIASKVFQTSSHKLLTEAKANTVHYGEILDTESHTLDDVLVTVFRAPHSYTGEDSVEISCHGSRYILGQVLQRLIDAGCRQAEPGEYTRRAYLNGKLDLSQAEAVADLIASTNRATHRMALSQLKGHFSSELARLREQLLKLTSLLELELDFSDHEELEFADRTELQELATQIDRRITTLAHSFETGNALKQGIPVAIVGKTNVGKSTLLNRLLHEEKAIVSDIHGTTRDVIEDTVQLQGIAFRFIDTAGIRKTDDIVEKLGIERTYEKIAEAIIILWVIDKEPAVDEVEEMKAKCEGKKLITVRNKMDNLTPSAPMVFTPSSATPLSEDRNPLVKGSVCSQPQKITEQKVQAKEVINFLPIGDGVGEKFVRLSAKTGLGMENLETALVKAADIPEITENDVIITSARHYEALQHAHDNLQRVLEGMSLALSADLLSEDLRLVLHDLSEITGGEIVTNEVLGNIFKHFCVGK